MDAAGPTRRAHRDSSPAGRHTASKGNTGGANAMAGCRPAGAPYGAVGGAPGWALPPRRESPPPRRGPRTVVDRRTPRAWCERVVRGGGRQHALGRCTPAAPNAARPVIRVAATAWHVAFRSTSEAGLRAEGTNICACTLRCLARGVCTSPKQPCVGLGRVLPLPQTQGQGSHS